MPYSVAEPGIDLLRRNLKGIHGIPERGHHQKVIVTLKQPVEYLPTRDSSGRVRDN